MKKFGLTTGALTLGLLVSSGFGATALQAQGGPGPYGRWPLQPTSSTHRVVGPFLEGWYENEDGTYSYSFGYSNYNDYTVYLPLGEKNTVTPAQFDGMQPTVFLPGRHRGVFTVTVPASMSEDVWWTLENANGRETKIPGRHVAGAYQLDWNPRPHGTLPPRVTFGSSNEAGRGPVGIVSPEVTTGRVGQEIELSVDARDISERDHSDPRFREAIPVRVNFEILQGPEGAEVTYTRHPDTEQVADRSAGNNPDDPDAGGPRRPRREPPPEQVDLPEGFGTAKVLASFNMPGEYIIRAQADQFAFVPDSNGGDQCCWTNGYIRVRITQ